jgi:hypothetical protein
VGVFDELVEQLLDPHVGDRDVVEPPAALEQERQRGAVDPSAWS